MAWSDYDDTEVDQLVKSYIELQPNRTRPYIWPRMMDLEIGLKRLPPSMAEAVFWHGLAGLSLRAAADTIGTSHQTVYTRYALAIPLLTSYMNGDFH